MKLYSRKEIESGNISIGNNLRLKNYISIILYELLCKEKIRFNLMMYI